MVKIYKLSQALIVEDTDNIIFAWNHKAFFTISLGFEYSEERGQYYIDDMGNARFYIEEIVSYLHDENIDFETDAFVYEIITQINNQNKEFEEVKDQIEHKKTTDSFPIQLKRDLKPYQQIGVDHLCKIKHGANFSVPGSGKTTVVYGYYEYLKNNDLAEKIFVVGPFSSFSPWEEESKLCFGAKLSTARLVGSKRNSYYLQSADYELFLCHYQTVANDLREIIQLCSKYKTLLVVDESHNIKRFEGGVWANALIKISPFAKRRVILSGTPMPNGYLDLYSQMTFLWPGKQLFGERSYFKKRCEDFDQQELIKKQIRPYFYRVKKDDLHLPDPCYHRIEYTLNPIQHEIYRAVSIKFLSELNLPFDDRQKLKQWRKAKMIRLLQVASNPTLLTLYSEEFDLPPYGSDGTSMIELIEKYSKFEIPVKFQAAVNLVMKLLSEGKKVLLWTTFVHNIKMLEKSLKNIKLYSIYGAIPKDDKEDEEFNREKIIADFKSSKEPAVLIANPAACAESISLHMYCHDAIYLDRSFNCGQYIQSLDRIHRIGLNPEDKINYYILIGKNTIDETVNHRLEDKKRIMEHVLEDEIPIGTFEVEVHEMQQTEAEEIADFNSTIEDTRKFLTT